jgi:phosphomannomutase
MTLPTPENPRIIALFDVDGTLTIPRGVVSPEMMETLKELRKKIAVGIVGGSDLPKQEEQLGDGIVNEVMWNFSQNGLVAYHNGTLLESNSIAKHLGEDNVKRIVNWVLRYLSDLDIPIKVSRSFRRETLRCRMFCVDSIPWGHVFARQDVPQPLLLHSL